MLLATSGALYGLTIRDEFRLDPARVTVDGAVYTAVSAVTAMLGLDAGGRPNIFRLRTVDLAAALRELPAVLDADVDAILPDRLAIRLHERTPILVWQWQGDTRMLVDVEGVMFARLASDCAYPPELPIVTDRRDRATPPSEGERLDAIDFTAVRLLAAVTPAMLASRATSLALSVDDVGGVHARRQAGSVARDLRVLHAAAAQPRAHPRPGAVPRRAARPGRAGHHHGRPVAGRRALRHVQTATRCVGTGAGHAPAVVQRGALVVLGAWLRVPRRGPFVAERGGPVTLADAAGTRHSPSGSLASDAGRDGAEAG